MLKLFLQVSYVGFFLAILLAIIFVLSENKRKNTAPVSRVDTAENETKHQLSRA